MFPWSWKRIHWDVDSKHGTGTNTGEASVSPDEFGSVCYTLCCSASHEPLDRCIAMACPTMGVVFGQVLNHTANNRNASNAQKKPRKHCSRTCSRSKWACLLFGDLPDWCLPFVFPVKPTLKRVPSIRGTPISPHARGEVGHRQ